MQDRLLAKLASRSADEPDERGYSRLLFASVICATLAGSLAFLALLGYTVDVPILIHVKTGLEGMSPLTSGAILALSGSALASTSRRQKLVFAGSILAIVAAGATLVSRFVSGADTASLWIGTTVFHIAPSAVGRTSIATAVCLLLVSAALNLRRFPKLADLAASGGLVISGVAVLGYFYGVNDLYQLFIFNSMALNTAIALFLLSVGAFLAKPTLGWASIIGSMELGGGATRRQLAFVAMPILAGKLLLWATEAAGLGPTVAMALLVAVTVLPLAALILRDGYVLNALDRERRTRLREQDELAAEMVDRLARQAAELARESNERARVEAAMYHAQRMEAVGQLTGGIAHDFNNLLMAVRGNLELLLRRLPADDDRLRRYVTNAMGATDKGAKITGQLLAFSRSQRMDIRAVKLDPVLTSARELIGNALGPHIKLELRLDSGGAWVVTDPISLNSPY